MEITEISTKSNALLSRKEVSARIIYSGTTPSTEDVRKQFAAKLSADEKLIVVKHIGSNYGGGSGKSVVYVYDDEKSRMGIEPKVKVKEKK